MKVDTDFSEITAGTAAGSSRGWDNLSGSNLQFIAGAIQDIALQPTGAGTCLLNRYSPDAPETIHQGAELNFTFGGSGTCGVFLRATDANNYVRGVVNHSTRVATIVERIAGVDTTLATVTGAAPAAASGAAIRFEVIGRRARIAFRKRRSFVGDLPPDTAANLSGTYTSAGQWGIYVNAAGSGGMEINHFTARDLPSVAPTPPSLYLEDATVKGPDFVTITATVAAVSAGIPYIEWMVIPTDTDDIADIYTDYTIASITSRIFYVRPGYSYYVRAREITNTGGLGGWAAGGLTASGSKTSPSTPTYPTDVFPTSVPAPDYILPRTQVAKVFAFAADTQREHLAGGWKRPRNSPWVLRWSTLSKTDKNTIVNFFNQMRGKERPFKWTHPTTSENYTVRFDADEAAPQTVEPGGLLTTDSPLYSLELPIVECGFGVVGALAASLTLDSGF